MRRLLKGLGTILLFAVVALCFAPFVVPPFLDRIYYQGPVSDHFDGERFFNPGAPSTQSGNPRRFFNRVIGDDARAVWPEQVAVTQTVPTPLYGDSPVCITYRRQPISAASTTEMKVTWIGHATVLIQTRWLTILVDPIWSDRASPFSFVGPQRVRAPGVAFESLPPVDLVLISHNHYDHLDLPTLKRLWERDQPMIVTSLGNDAILRQAGIGAKAADWGDKVTVRGEGPIAPCVGEWGIFDVMVERNHHWSSRWGTDRNRALWSGFTVVLPGGNIFFAGDTGFGDGSWVAEAAARGPVRFAILPIGAYEPRDVMKENHVNPEEAMRIFEALNPTQALGVHWGTFQLTFEPIDEPRQRLEALKRARGLAPDRFVAVEAGQSFEVPRR